MKKKLRLVAFVLLICVAVTGCTVMDPHGKQETQKEPESPKQTVYLPASYKLTSEEETIDRQYRYNELGQCIQCTEIWDSEGWGHLETLHTYTYDDHGNLIRETCHQVRTKNGTTKESNSEYLYFYVYDEKGRITEYSYDDGNHTFYFDYDDEKNQLVVTSRNEEWKHYYQYDQEGRITQELYCIPLPEGYMEDWNYNSTLRTFVYNDSGKIETYAEKFCYTIDPCDLSQIDQVQDWKNNYETTYYYDDRGNLTGVGRPDQYEYDENNLLILKDVIEMVPIRGEIVERIYAKYTRDEYGNILRFEEYRFSEDATWVAMELTESQAEAAERRLFMNVYGYDIFDVLKNVWVQPYPSPWSYDVFAHLISGAPW